MDAAALRTKLQDPSAGGPVDRLACLAVEQVLDAPVAALVSPELLARGARLALSGWLSSEDAVPALRRGVQALADRLSADGRPLAAIVPHDVRQALRDLARRPYSPDRRLVLTVIDRPPVRGLVRGLLFDAVLHFGREISAPVGSVAQGVSGLARFALETAKAYSGSVGAVVGVISDQVERQLEKRAAEFADVALSGVFAQIADTLSNPGRDAEAALLRSAVAEGVFEVTLAQLAAELARIDVPAGAVIVREGLWRWLQSPDADAQLVRWANLLLDRDGPRRVGDVLHELGLVEAARQVGREVLRARMEAVVASDTFAAWLDALLA